ncbi:MAG: ribbon-helix-helix domain-containing protein [Candidatus Methanoperedens sp.]|nr:ribbon-helix-helix domain-containing protein [Candidatus Methanoperedens sp.]
MTKSKGKRTKSPGGGVPTYIRFTRDQLKAMDDAVKKGRFLNRSEAARVAVTQMFGIPLPDTAAV